MRRGQVQTGGGGEMRENGDKGDNAGMWDCGLCAGMLMLSFRKQGRKLDTQGGK